MACAAAAMPKTEVTQTEEPNPAQLSPAGPGAESQLAGDAG
jgi:hypothetical protein